MVLDHGLIPFALGLRYFFKSLSSQGDSQKENWELVTGFDIETDPETS